MAKLNLAEIKFWIKEAEACLRRQQVELIRRNNYPFLINYFEGKFQINPSDPHVASHQLSSIINEYFPNTNAKISEIMYQNPDIMAEALKPEAEDGAPLMKSALTYFFSKANGLVENRVALFDMLYAGYCAVEVDHIIDQRARLALTTPEQDLPKDQSLLQRVIANVKKSITNEKEAEEKLEKQLPPENVAFATNEGSYIRRWSPINVPLDWQASRLKYRRYNLKKIEMTKAQFDTKYPKFKDKVSAGNESLEFSQSGPDLGHFHDHSKIIKLYEFQIKKRNHEFWTLVIAPSHPQEEIDLYKRPYTTNGFNMKIGTLHKYGKLYPIAFAQVNKKMADELEHYVRHMMEVAERNVPKFIINKNKVKTDGKEALRSEHVNDLVEVEGPTTGAVEPQRPTSVSPENKELMGIFQRQKEKLWAVSESRTQGKSQAEFATELQIQEAGFQVSNVDIQEGLRMLIESELETGKDLIASFWDGEYFFKVTSGQKPVWYASNTVNNPINNQPMVLNPLTDILTGDYFISVNIQTALRPNIERQKAEHAALIEVLVGPNVQAVLAAQGKQLSVEFIERLIKKSGFNPENVIIDLQPVAQPAPGQVPVGI